MNKNFLKFNQFLEDWYAKNQRDFPWRKTNDAYKIWVSEIMSHQTQISRVAEIFYPRFLEKYPNIETLAKTNWEELYKVWDGLGYYNRGKNLLRTAKIVCKYYEAKFPQDLEKLEKLPGIGKYTAAALMSFAFDQKVPAIDTNISKIISTLWPDLSIVETAKILVENASSGKDWNSAMMDLASFIRAEKPIEGALGKIFFPEDVLKKFKPVKKNRLKRKVLKKNKQRIEVGIACIWENGKYLAQTRPKGKSFAGFWEFPGGKREKGESFRNCVKREIREEIDVEVSVRPHFYEELLKFESAELLLRFHRAQIQKGIPKPLENQKIMWIKPMEFFDKKFLKTNHNALRKLQKMRV